MILILPSPSRLNSLPSSPLFMLLMINVLLLHVVILNTFLPLVSSFLLHPSVYTRSRRRIESFGRASCLRVTTISNNGISGNIILEEDNVNIDEEDLYLRSLYPPKSPLFDETNVIVKSFPLLSKSKSQSGYNDDNLF